MASKTSLRFRSKMLPPISLSQISIISTGRRATLCPPPLQGHRCSQYCPANRPRFPRWVIFEVLHETKLPPPSYSSGFALDMHSTLPTQVSTLCPPPLLYLENNTLYQWQFMVVHCSAAEEVSKGQSFFVTPLPDGRLSGRRMPWELCKRLWPLLRKAALPSQWYSEEVAVLGERR